MSDYETDQREAIAERQYAADVDDLERRFTFHPADTTSRREGHERVRLSAHTFALDLLHLVPPSDERRRAIEAVEVAMWSANAGIARHYETATGPLHAQIKGDPVPLRERTAGSLGLTGQQDVEPDPVGETQNPASLVGTEDMPAPEPPGPVPPVAPARNVTEPAEAPAVPGVPPEYADDPLGENVLGVVMVPTTDGGTIAVTVAQAQAQPFEGARWDVNGEAWETSPRPEDGAGQPDTATADPDVETSP